MLTYSAGSLCRTYQAAKSWDPAAPFIDIRDGWGTVLTAGEWLAWFREKLFEKIASHEPARVGRKLRPEWQREAARVARMLRDGYFTRVSDCPRELRGRLSHRLHRFEE